VALFAGAWAIFGHDNVAAQGNALYEAREALPLYWLVGRGGGDNPTP
jgi:3D-(3,5/4)-trihydroxycyclohexane-1,2-dione acylhydrolase (decyclizing)